MKPIISPNIRIRHPEMFQVGHYSIVDDFCYFSTQVKIGTCSHVASGCSIGGGGDYAFEMGDFSSLSSGVKIWCVSNDFVRDLVTIIPEGIFLEDLHTIQGNVSLGDYTAIGSNTVVMPDNRIPEGCVIGALSFVPAHYTFESWTVYVGTPVRPIKKRDRENVLRQAVRLRDYLTANPEASSQ
jgi:acetyltransferase-like isoleucine patch superfamily enzyme